MEPMAKHATKPFLTYIACFLIEPLTLVIFIDFKMNFLFDGHLAVKCLKSVGKNVLSEKSDV